MHRPSALSTLLVATAVISMTAGSVRAEPVGGAVTPAETLDHIYPRYDRAALANALRDLDLDRDQRLIIDMLIADYVAGLGDLVDRTDQAADAAGRSRVDDVLTGRARASGDDLRSMRIAVLRAYAEAWPESDALLDGLEAGIAGIVLDDLVAPVLLAFRDIRRTAWLEPRRTLEMQPSYAGDGVDVGRLVAEAADAELRRVDPTALSGAVDRYADVLDLLLGEIGPADRQGDLDRRVAAIRRDAAALAALETVEVQRWRRLFEANVSAVAAIEGLIPDVEDKARWRTRFDEASFPWLLRDTLPARQYAWISGEESIDAARREQAGAIMLEDRAKRSALSREAISIMIEGRTRFGRIVHPSSDVTGPPGSRPDANLVRMQQALLKNSGLRTALDNETSTKLRALLTPDERRDLDRRVR
ncbi:MAG: hypothetical protein ACYTF9_08325 [Planctomycetota bacterium]|jgi:hypothetical protein